MDSYAAPNVQSWDKNFNEEKMIKLVRDDKKVPPLASKKHKYSALIVEDDMAITNMIDEAMRSTGMFAQLDWATSSEEARSYIRKRLSQGKKVPYDLIVLDVFLEGHETGIDLWQEMFEEIQEVPIIMTSSISENRFSHLVGQYAIMPTFLKKPFNIKSCVNSIGEALNRPRWN